MSPKMPTPNANNASQHANPKREQCLPKTQPQMPTMPPKMSNQHLPKSQITHDLASQNAKPNANQFLSKRNPNGNET